MQHRIRVQIQNPLALRKINFCRFGQSYYHSELPSGPSLSVYENPFGILLCSNIITFLFQQSRDRTYSSPKGDSCILFAFYFCTEVTDLEEKFLGQQISQDDCYSPCKGSNCMLLNWEQLYSLVPTVQMGAGNGETLQSS